MIMARSIVWVVIFMLIKLSCGYFGVQRRYHFDQRSRIFRPNQAADEVADTSQGNLLSVDYTALSPDDPLFLDMPWPVESGPESSAFARHMQWKRQLSDSERLRWQRWAVYQRSNAAEQFSFGLQDFISQGLRSRLKEEGRKCQGIGSAVNASIHSALTIQLQSVEETEVRAVMKAYYSAFNRMNFDDLRLLWLPSKDCELVLPGFEKARGDREVEELYRRVATASKPMGKVTANTTQVSCHGNIAMVHTLEEVGPGATAQLYTRPSRRYGVGPAPTKASSAATPRVLATTVLRRANRQWRILSHHAVPVQENPFAGDEVGVTFTHKDAARRKRLMHRLTHGTQSRPMARDDAEQLAGRGVPADISTLLQQHLERILRDTPRVAADTAPARHELHRRPDGGLQRIISLMPLLPVGAGKPIGPSPEPTVDRHGENSSVPNVLGVDFAAPASQQTVQAIRSLRSLGRLDPQQQQALLADVVACAARGAVSRAQAACQLLYAAPLRHGAALGRNSNTAEEEFAEDLAQHLRMISGDLLGAE